MADQERLMTAATSSDTERTAQTAPRPAAEGPVPTGIALTPLDPTFREDPYPRLDELRRREPVHHDQVFQQWYLTRHDDVAAVMRDKTLCKDPHKGAPGTFADVFLLPQFGEEPSILFLDPPRHTKLRGLVSKAFSPRAVEQMGPRIQQITDALLDRVASAPGFDLVTALAGPLPTIVIAEMLGVDPAHKDDFKRWSDDQAAMFDPTVTQEARERMLAAQSALRAYLQREVTARRASPRDDLLSGLIAAEEQSERLTDREIVTMCVFLLIAGNLTTTDLIANGVLALLEHPGELRKLQEDPSLIKNAVEEILRFDSPVMHAGRIVPHEVTIGGCTIGKGEHLTTFLSAANRDPEVYPEPDRFDITRKDTHHQSFGGGVHFCLGAPLARLEGQIAIGTLVRRFPRIRRGEGAVVRRQNQSFRGIAALPVLVS